MVNETVELQEVGNMTHAGFTDHKRKGAYDILKKRC